MEERLKRRLVGAVVLVLAVVIFVPMFLGAPHEIHVETSSAGDSASKDPEVEDAGDTPLVSRPAETVSIVRIASDGTVKHESTSAALEAVDPGKKERPAKGDSKAAVDDDKAGGKDRASVANESPAKRATSASDATAKTDTLDEPLSDDSSKSESAEEDRKTGASVTENMVSPGGWVVQVGSFSDAKNAETLKEKFRQNGYRVFTVSGRSASGDARMTRVFVGSEDSREKADVLKARIEGDRRIGISKGLVRPWPEEAHQGR